MVRSLFPSVFARDFPELRLELEVKGKVSPLEQRVRGQLRQRVIAHSILQGPDSGGLAVSELLVDPQHDWLYD